MNTYAYKSKYKICDLIATLVFVNCLGRNAENAKKS